MGWSLGVEAGISHHGTTVGTSVGGIACPEWPSHQMIGPEDAGTEIPL